MTGAVLFDLDETLTDRTASIVLYAQRFHSDFGKAFAQHTPGDVARVIADADQRGYAPRGVVFDALVSRLTWQHQVDATLLAAHWDAWYPMDTLGRPDIVSTLRTLRDRGWRLGVITNGATARQEPKIDVLGIRPLLSVVVVSETVGIKKPDPGIFQLALESLRCSASDAWFVGDHPDNDIIGAQYAGLKAIWLRGVHRWPDAFPEPSFQIDRISEVLQIVKNQTTSSQY